MSETLSSIGASSCTNGAATLSSEHRKRSVMLRVSGGSMFPTLLSGDFVWARREEFVDILPGDIIAFVRDDRSITHRVIRRVPFDHREDALTCLITRGDAVGIEDAPVHSEEYLGRITRVHRGSNVFSLDVFPRRLRGWIFRRFPIVSMAISSAAVALVGWRDRFFNRVSRRSPGENRVG